MRNCRDCNRKKIIIRGGRIGRITSSKIETNGNVALSVEKRGSLIALQSTFGSANINIVSLSESSIVNIDSCNVSNKNGNGIQVDNKLNIVMNKYTIETKQTCVIVNASVLIAPDCTLIGNSRNCIQVRNKSTLEYRGSTVEKAK
jgi:hypothetical protein